MFPSSIQSFLKTARTILSSPTNARPPLTIVIGNQSGDLDSILSALVLAYVLQAHSTISTSTRRTYIPLTNLESSDLLLRPELLPALSRSDIQPTELFTLHHLRNAFFSEELQKQGVGKGTKWILVDHNKLELPFSSPKWKIARENVVGCIDHHNEENYVLPQRPDSPDQAGEGVDMRIIQKTGSCMTHVINYTRQLGVWRDAESPYQELPFSSGRGSRNLEIRAQTAFIALAPILIDTSNLKDTAKTTEADVEAVEFLEEKIVAWENFRRDQNGGQNSYTRDSYFTEVNTAKQNLEPLTLTQILRKDYKEWEDNKGRRLGTSAVVKPLEWMVEKVGRSELLRQKDGITRDKKLEVVWETVNQFVESRVDEPDNSGKHKGLDIFSIMTGFTDEKSGKFRRQLFVSPITEIGSEALSSFEETLKEKFLLDPISGWKATGSEIPGSRVWEQGNLGASRKELAPALRQILEEV